MNTQRISVGDSKMIRSVWALFLACALVSIGCGGDSGGSSGGEAGAAGAAGGGGGGGSGGEAGSGSGGEAGGGGAAGREVKAAVVAKLVAAARGVQASLRFVGPGRDVPDVGIEEPSPL